MLRKIGFPGEYVQGPKALLQLGALLEKMGYRRPLTLCDGIVEARVWPLVEETLRIAGLGNAKIAFPGECTKAVIGALAARAQALAPDVIVALGGGKTIDAAKGISVVLDVPIVVCPTIASNDAPTSRLIVLYDDAHRIAGVEYLMRNPAAVIVDTEIIARAPVRFFAAGIGDAISKKFEAAQCVGAQGHNSFGTPPLDTALLLANATYDTLSVYGPRAWRAVSEGRLNDDVERVVEGTVLLSGIGFESGGLSLAHALIRGLTAIPSMAAMLHGELVAFGTLVQLLVEQRSEAQVDALLALLLAVRLPVTFADLGQREPLGSGQMETIVDATLAAAYSKNMHPPLSAAKLAEALREADRIGRAAARN